MDPERTDYTISDVVVPQAGRDAGQMLYVIGIDGEYLPRYAESRTDYAMLADRFFSGEESEYVRSGATVVDEKERFMKIWTRKEAYVKCTGKGVADFPSFSVVESDKLVAKLGNIPLKKFSINFEGCEDYLFAIAGNLK